MIPTAAGLFKKLPRTLRRHRLMTAWMRFTGEDPLQLVALDLRKDRRTSVTHLPSPPDSDRTIRAAAFVGRGRVRFLTRANPHGLNRNNELCAFSVRTNGTGLLKLRCKLPLESAIFPPAPVKNPDTGVAPKRSALPDPSILQRCALPVASKRLKSAADIMPEAKS